LLAAAYDTMKEVDPAVLVVGPCSVGPGDLTNPASLRALAWIEGLLSVRRPLFDRFSFHPYEGKRSPEQADLVAAVSRLRSLLRGAGYPDRIWITEQGWASALTHPIIDDMEQARLLARAYLLSQAAGVEAFFWYDARNDGWAQEDREDNFGLLRRDFIAKASARVPAVLADALHDRTFTDMTVTPAGVYTLDFTGGGALPPVLAAWSHQAPAYLSLALGEQGGVVRDLDGTAASLPAGSHGLALPAGLVRLVEGEVTFSAATT
jgi:hypothetical protein